MGDDAVGDDAVGDDAVEDNAHAGQGAVVLDIGGDIGALVLLMPAAMEGVEIEARPVRSGPAGPVPEPGRAHGPGPDPGHEHGHDHGHDHRHGAGTGAGTSPGPGHEVGSEPGAGRLEHVAVVPRPVPDGRRLHSAVFPALPAGTYELYERPAGPVRLSVEVRGGAVADAVWP